MQTLVLALPYYSSTFSRNILSLKLPRFSVFSARTRSSSEMELITRRVIYRLEDGKVSEEVLKEYADPTSEKYARMCEEIRKIGNFTTLRYHDLNDMVKSIGLPKAKLCTYCFDKSE